MTKTNKKWGVTYLDSWGIRVVDHRLFNSYEEIPKSRIYPEREVRFHEIEVEE